TLPDGHNARCYNLDQDAEEIVLARATQCHPFLSFEHTSDSFRLPHADGLIILIDVYHLVLCSRSLFFEELPPASLSAWDSFCSNYLEKINQFQVADVSFGPVS
ncbi:hypothetical protein, partial [Acinetobacter baumannii]|uniref:hypothetical protein n=1 Tax=Acinetobacter baumannii TaxID=470 RepID=UPI00339A03C6